MSKPAAVVLLQAEREKKILNYYPWVYAQEIAGVTGDPAPGDIVQVQSARGQFLGRAFYNSSSHIPVRMLTFDPDQPVNRAFFEDRIRSALARREGRIRDTNAIRVVHGEADQLPGLVIDRFADSLVLQLRNQGMERWREEIVRACKRVLEPTGIYERSDTQARTEEGLEPAAGLLWGAVPDRLDVFEDDIHFDVSVHAGQKTGFYLDQRDNRRLVGSLVTTGSTLLDVYSYTGAFSLHAARAGAQCLAIDKDADALETLEANARRNRLASRVGARWGDALEVLSSLGREGRRFSHIVLDPPTLAKHKNDIPRVKHLFTEMTALALALLEPAGNLLLSTCAYHITTNDLIESVRIGAGDLHRRMQVLKVTYQPADHPWILQVPETLYLKSVILRIDG